MLLDIVNAVKKFGEGVCLVLEQFGIQKDWLEAVSRPDLYFRHLLTDFNFLKPKMLAIKNKVGLPKANLGLEVK